MIDYAMKVHTVRFGDISVDPEQLLHFPEGLLGLGGSDYALIPARQGPFLWLQSLNEPGVALPLAPPESFFPDYVLEISPEDRESLPEDGFEDAEVYVTVRAAAEPSECTVNLKAPVLVWLGDGSGPREAYQVINRRAGAALRAPLFAAA